MSTSARQVVVIGGGTAGITVASQLAKKAGKTAAITVIEPSAKHYYQPLWTLVGGGAVRKEKTVRDTKDVIPRGVRWVQDAVETIDPGKNTVTTRVGREAIPYDVLVVAAGLQLDWGRIPGLVEGLGKNGICSIYDYEKAEHTWKTICEFRGGTALFTQPGTPIKCAGAPQKIMYLADDTFRKNGVREKTRILFRSGLDKIFGVPEFAKTLNQVIERKRLETAFLSELIAVNADRKIATFKSGDQEESVSFDMLHVTPRMSAPDFLKRSPLIASEGTSTGWVDVDSKTLRHRKFANVFALGDCAGLPTSKTGAAIRKQAPVVVKNVIEALAGAPATAVYDGYTSCPLITGYGRLVLAEFDYDKKPRPSFPIDTTQERLSMFLLKRHLLPWMYWNLMMKGHPF